MTGLIALNIGNDTSKRTRWQMNVKTENGLIVRQRRTKASRARCEEFETQPLLASEEIIEDRLRSIRLHSRTCCHISSRTVTR